MRSRRTRTWTLIREHLSAIPRICAGGPDAGPIGQLSMKERFHWLVAPRSTVVQVSPVHSGLTDDPEATIERLMDRMVRPPRPGDPKTRSC